VNKSTRLAANMFNIKLRQRYIYTLHENYLTRRKRAIDNGKFYVACFQLASDGENVFLAEANDAVTWPNVVERHCT